MKMKRRLTALAAAAAGLLLLVSCSKSKTIQIDLKEAYVLSLSGVNEKGLIEAEFDEDYLIEAVYPDDLSDEEEEARDDKYDDILDYVSSLDLEIDGENGSLKNGDKLQLVFERDKEEEKELGIALKNDKFKYEVEGLKDALQVDPFESLSVTFEGVDGHGKVKLEAETVEGAKKAKFDVDKDKDLKNGDKIEVEFDFDHKRAEEDGYVFEPISKVYTVEGLKEVETLDPFSFAEVTFEGYDGYGEADWVLKGEFPNINNPKFSLEDKDELKNGDKIKLEFSYDEEKSEAEGYLYSPLEKEYEVQGLKPLETVDPFTALTVSFEGLEGQGRVQLEAGELPGLSDAAVFEAEPSEGLKSGDKVVVRFMHDADVSIDEGVIFEPLEKEYEAEGLDALHTLTADDLKDGYKLSFEGAVPRLEVKVEKVLEGDLAERFDYKLTQNDNRIGGKLVITAECNKDKEYMESIGYILPDEGKFEFRLPLEAGNVPIYVTELSQISLETRQEIAELLKETMETKIEGYIIDDTDLYYNLRNGTYKRTREVTFLSLKPEELEDFSGKLFNRIVMVVELNCEVKKSYWDPWEPEPKDDLYLPPRVDNIILHPDGSNTYDENSMTCTRNVKEYSKLLEDSINFYQEQYTIDTYKAEDFLK